MLLDGLDVGLVLVTDGGKILRRNAIASRMLAAFGKDTDCVPVVLWRRLESVIAAALAVPGRFTPSSPMTSPAHGRYFARMRALPAGALVLSIAQAALREVDVARVLTEKFGLSAQEIRIAFLAAQGYRNREIAKQLEVVEGTIKNYLTNVFSALSVRSRTELASELAQLVDDQDHRLDR
jgi:DNA-binding CsgD family transcriptional regulator